ncbi:MAG: NUDIX domain-containing protein [Patescibacteria group bacterium]
MEVTTLDELGRMQLASEAYVICGDEILMHKRSDTAKKFPGFWIGPGGHIDSNEDALTAAIREVEEETGVKIDEKDIRLKAIAFHYHIDRNECWISFIFLARISKHQDAIEETAEGRSRWLPLSELVKLENVFPPSQYYFEHVLNDKPGILYTNITWKDSKLVKEQSVRVDKDL